MNIFSPICTVEKDMEVIEFREENIDITIFITILTSQYSILASQRRSHDSPEAHKDELIPGV